MLLGGKLMSIKNSLNRAEVLYREQAFDESISICQKLLLKKPKLLNARQILALNYQSTGQLTQAIVEFKHVIAIDDKHASSYNNLGNIYLALKQFKPASQYYYKALHIEPMMAEACNNLATCLLKLGDVEAAEANYKKAMLLDGSNAEFSMNLGMLLCDLGRFESATELLLKTLAMDSAYSRIYWHVCKIFLYQHRYQDALEIADLGLLSNTLSEMELCELLVAKAILFWLFYNPEEGNLAIALSEGVYQYQGHSANMANVVVFHRYIKKLFELRKLQPELYCLSGSNDAETAVKEIYFVAESHGFAPNNTIIQYQQQPFQVRSLFMLGAKIFHLVAEQDNKYQTSLVTLFSGLVPGSKVVLAFGEIDCRINEGIFVHCQKRGLAYQDVITDMLNRYVTMLTEQAKHYGIDIILYGVPAPHPHQVNKLSLGHQSTFKKLVAFFNLSLKQLCFEQGLSFLDVYQLTLDRESQQSNLAYHIDDIHLQPSTVAELFLQISK
jgi:Flp pilus assembly protein TadD